MNAVNIRVALSGSRNTDSEPLIGEVYRLTNKSKEQMRPKSKVRYEGAKKSQTQENTRRKVSSKWSVHCL
jgi:hypothetical protein